MPRKPKAPDNRPKFMQYPVPQGGRSGCKVSWNWYDSEEDAKACSKAAIHNAEIQWAAGYDFGYQSPGSILKMENGQFEVCLP